MPGNLDRCVQHLMEQGHSEEEARAICNSVMEMIGPKPEDEKSGNDHVYKGYVADTAVQRNGDIEAFISTESVDRMGDIILSAGWELDRYRKSGSPVLFGHEYRLTAAGIPHIGNAIQMEVQRDGLWSVTRFHEKTQLSRESALLAREKIMPAWSVGFDPMEAPKPREEDGEVKGFIYTKQELMEYSLVPVPANADATSRAMHYARKGLISGRTAALIAGPSPQADMGRRDTERELADYIAALTALRTWS